MDHPEEVRLVLLEEVHQLVHLHQIMDLDHLVLLEEVHLEDSPWVLAHHRNHLHLDLQEVVAPFQWLDR